MGNQVTVFDFKYALFKAFKAVLVAGVAGALLGVTTSGNVSGAFNEIPLVGGLLFGAFLGGVEALRNYLKVKFGWPL